MEDLDFLALDVSAEVLVPARGHFMWELDLADVLIVDDDSGDGDGGCTDDGVDKESGGMDIQCVVDDLRRVVAGRQV